MNKQPVFYLTPALLALFVSGAASLILETLWFEWLALHWGRTAEASTAVLSCFMFGLGIGQWCLSRFPTLPYSAVKLWALCEALVGLLAYLANQRFTNTALPLDFSALPWMLAPTFFMGISLPLAITVIQQQSFSRSVGLAYAINTAGATLGCMAGGWWLTQQFGLNQSGFIAVLGQLLAATLVLLIRPTKTRPTTQPVSSAASHRKHWPALIAVACSGLFILGMETIWFRSLLLAHRSTSENFALMLAAVLLGLAFGSALAALLKSPLKRWPNPLQLAVLLLIQCTICLLTLLLWQPNTEQLLLNALLLITPSCMCSGALMVIAAQNFSTENSHQSGAKLILASTIGSSLGAPLVALWLIPQAGVTTSVSLLLAVVSVAAFLNHRRAGLLGLVVICILLWPLSQHWQQKQQRAAQLYMQLDQAELVYQADGKYQSVQLLEQSFLGQPLSHRLVTDSYSMTSTATDSERYMRMFAWLPQAMRADLGNALLISYGLGTTAEALLQHPATRQLTVADPSTQVLAASRLIKRQPEPLNDPRVVIKPDDGRHVLQQSPNQFDVITGEPPPPRLAGMHALYSQEYFQLMQQALKPQGWASYWLPVDQLSLASSQAIISAFCKAFNDCSLWAGSHYNWILLGSKQGAVHSNAIKQLWRHNAEVLADSGLESPEQLASSFIAGPNTLKKWAMQQAPLTDNWPKRIQRQWPTKDDIETYARWMDDRETEQRFQQSRFHQNWQLAPHQLALAWALQPLLNGQFRPNPAQRLQVIDQILGLSHWQTPILWVLGTDKRRVEMAARHNSPSARLHHAVGLLAAHRFEAAARHFDALAQLPQSPFPLAADLAALAKKHAGAANP